MSYLDHSRYRGVDGVVIACVNFNDPEIIELIQSDVPVVTIDHVFNNRTSIISDNIKGIHDLLTYIYQMGHRRIAYIHGADSSVTQNRLGSFYQTLDQLHLDVSNIYIKSGAYRDSDTASKLTLELLDLPEQDRPTCIFYPDDYACIGGINAIKERGLRIPDDISVVGYDGIQIAGILEPTITTLKQDTKLIGREAAEKLISSIEKPKSSIIERIIVRGVVLPGNSVKKL